MKVFELINPSDPYTFEAPSIEVAGVVAVLLSGGFGAVNVAENCGPCMNGPAACVSR